MQQMNIFDYIEDNAANTNEDKNRDKSGGLGITFVIYFYDKDDKNRIEWYRGNDEGDVTKQLMNEYGRNIRICDIRNSVMTLEEAKSID